jgi:hypothetical protein
MQSSARSLISLETRPPPSLTTTILKPRTHAQLFKPNSTLGKACHKLGGEVIKLLPQIEKQINFLAWDYTAVCAALGECLVPCCQSKTLPEQTHIALGDDPSTMNVMWTVGELVAGSAVQWGLAANALSTNASATNATYTHWGWRGTVRVFRQKFTLGMPLDPTHVRFNDIPLGSLLFLPVDTVNCVAMLKASFTLPP